MTLEFNDIRPGMLILISSHPWNTGDVYGVFCVLHCNHHDIIMQATPLTKCLVGLVGGHWWTRFSQFARCEYGFKGIRIIRLA